MLNKAKRCQWEGCDELVASFPNSTIKQRHCMDHAIKTALAKAKSNISKAKQKDKKEKQDNLLSVSGYAAKYVQPIFNEIARLIDYGQPCIATGNFGKLSGGHYHSVGSNSTIRFHLDNIHVQSYHSNVEKSGDPINYRKGIIRIYGQAYMDHIESLTLIQPLNLTKSDLIEIKTNASQIRNELKKNVKILTPQERIDLRREINQKIGIYDDRYYTG